MNPAEVQNSGKPSSRAYSNRTLKILWGRAAGRCAVPECRVDVIADATDYDPVVVFGDIAHMSASSDTGPRASRAKPRKERDEYENLILLCKNCHTKLDGQKHTITIDYLRKIKEEHEAWVRASLPERGLSTTGWLPLVLRGKQPIDIPNALRALSPDFHSGQPEVINVDPENKSWQQIFSEESSLVKRLFGMADIFDLRLAIFPLAPISACTALGYLLTNRPRVRLFQYHRNDQSWAWPKIPVIEPKITVTGMPGTSDSTDRDLAFLFDVSASILTPDLDELALPVAPHIHISVEEPTTNWLDTEMKLKRLAEVARSVFEAASCRYPNSRKWHIFCAAAAPASVVIGQQLNPTMVPQVQLYEFNRRARPAYSPSLKLGD